MTKLIILDRDGVINYDSKEYIKSPDEWNPIPGSLEAIAKLYQADFKIVVATNQSGIARGLYNENILQLIHLKMKQAIEQLGGKIDAIFYCPHGPWDNCDCRKPKSGLFEQIAKHYACSLKGIPAIGDSQRDLEAALAVSCEPILVKTGNHETVAKNFLSDHNISCYKNLAHFVDVFLINF